MGKIEIEILGVSKDRFIHESFIVHFINQDNDIISRILVDGGNTIHGLKENYLTQLQLVSGIVITHTDQDHLFGTLGLLTCPEFKANNNLEFIIFNVIENPGSISYRQGIALKNVLKKDYAHVKHMYSNNSSYDDWNRSTRGNVHFFSLGKRDMLLKNLLDNIVYITFMNPTKKQYEALQKDWYKFYKDNQYSGDTKVINESSIVLLVEYSGYKILLTGDQKASSILEVFVSDASKNPSIIEGTDEEQARYKKWGIECMDLIKIPHHGSVSKKQKTNEMIGELGSTLNCLSYLLIPSPSVRIEKELFDSIKSSASKSPKIYSPISLTIAEEEIKVCEKIMIQREGINDD